MSSVGKMYQEQCKREFNRPFSSLHDSRDNKITDYERSIANFPSRKTKKNKKNASKENTRLSVFDRCENNGVDFKQEKGSFPTYC